MKSMRLLPSQNKYIIVKKYFEMNYTGDQGRHCNGREWPWFESCLLVSPVGTYKVDELILCVVSKQKSQFRTIIDRFYNIHHKNLLVFSCFCQIETQHVLNLG